jgi:hypothetical protein
MEDKLTEKIYFLVEGLGFSGLSGNEHGTPECPPLIRGGLGRGLTVVRRFESS